MVMVAAPAMNLFFQNLFEIEKIQAPERTE
jgi:hypothetical protein